MKLENQDGCMVCPRGGFPGEQAAHCPAPGPFLRASGDGSLAYLT